MKAVATHHHFDTRKGPTGLVGSASILKWALRGEVDSCYVPLVNALIAFEMNVLVDKALVDPYVQALSAHVSARAP